MKIIFIRRGKKNGQIFFFSFSTSDSNLFNNQNVHFMAIDLLIRKRKWAHRVSTYQSSVNLINFFFFNQKKIYGHGEW